VLSTNHQQKNSIPMLFSIGQLSDLGACRPSFRVGGELLDRATGRVLELGSHGF
jgi:hypothetical protein